MKIIVLDTTTKTICAALSSAVATSNPDFVVAYADTSDNTFSELSSDGQLNGTTDVTLVGAPASGVKRTIKSISVYNRDTAPVIVVIKLDVSGTQRILQRVQLVSGETWHSDELTKLSPGGSDTQVQFNDTGTLAGSSNFTYNKTTSVLTLGANPVLTAGTANGVLYLNGSKVATTGSALTFNGTTATVNSGNDNTGLVVSASNSTSSQVNIGVGVLTAARPFVGTNTNTNPLEIGTRAAADTIFVVNSTEQMRLTSTGLGIGLGGSSPAYKLDVKASGAFNVARFTGQGGSISTYIYTDSAYWWFGDGASFTGQGYTGNVTNKTLSLFTDSVERARITSGGYFKASNNGSYVGSTSAYHEMVSNDTGNTLVIRNSSTSSATDGTLFISNARNTTDNTYYIIGAYNTTAAAFKFRVADSGNVTNTNNSYGAISDVKTKQDIVDAASQWDDLKGLKVRKFRYKNDPTAPLQIGLVAQEAETVSPGLIDEHPDYEEVEVTDEEGNVKTERQLTGTSTKSIKYSVLYMKAIKALQEAMTRIETLEAKVAALEGTQP